MIKKELKEDNSPRILSLRPRERLGNFEYYYTIYVPKDGKPMRHSVDYELAFKIPPRILKINAQLNEFEKDKRLPSMGEAVFTQSSFNIDMRSNRGRIIGSHDYSKNELDYCVIMELVTFVSSRPR